MKKIPLFTRIFIAMLTLSQAGAFGQSVFQHAYGHTNSDDAFSVILTTDQSYLMTGLTTSFNSNSNEDVYLVKANRNGGLTWSKSIHMVGDERGYSATENFDTAAYYAVTGDVTAIPEEVEYLVSDDVFLMFNQASNGNPYFTGFYGTRERNEYARCIAKTNDDAYIIVGYTDSVCDGCTGNDVYLLKTDLSGNLIWAERIDINGGDDYGMKVIVNDDKYILTGYTHQGAMQNIDAFLIETETDGTVNWVKTYGDDANEYSFSVIQAGTGYTLAGHRYDLHSGGTPDAFVVRTDLSGVVEWKTIYDANTTHDINGARDIIYYEDADSYYLTGYVDYNSQSMDLYQIKLNGNGVMEWQRAFGEDPPDVGFSLVRDNNRIVMAGITYSYGLGNDDDYLVKTTLDGVLDCTNTLLDTNTTYLDSSYQEPESIFEIISTYYDGVYSWLSPTYHDSICFFDSTSMHGQRNSESVNVLHGNDVINVYPNPVAAGSQINIEFNMKESQTIDVEINDMLGKCLMKTRHITLSGHQRLNLTLPSLNEGIYLLHLKTISFEKTVKLVIVH